MEMAAAEFEQSAKQLGARIVEFSLEPPAFGQIRVAIEMRKLRHPISPAYARGVCSATISRQGRSQGRTGGPDPRSSSKNSAAFSANPLIPLL
jgi:hypothetical protein